MTVNDYLVSIVITCYNYEKYIEESIISALNQTYKNIEVVVINDGSADNSINIINKYKDKITIIDRQNKGIVHTRNEGLSVSNGDYIAFLDADDFFDNDYIEKMLRVAIDNNADVVYPNWRAFGEQNYINEFSEFDIKKLIKQEIHCSSESLIKKSSVIGHKFESEIVAEDWDFFLGMALDNRRFKLAKSCYINYRIGKNTRGSSRPYWDDMYYFYEILQKWNKKYPNIFNPIDLLVHAGKDRDVYIESQREHIESQARHIESQANNIKQKDEYIIELQGLMEDKNAEIEDLNARLSKVVNSKSYQTARKVSKPFRFMKKIIKKN